MSNNTEESLKVTLKKHPFLTLTLAVLGVYIMSHIGGDKETECAPVGSVIALEKSDIQPVKALVKVKTVKEASVAVEKVAKVADKTIVVKADGEKLFASLGCAGCHGVAGKSVIPTFPVLAGKDADYLATQLIDFQSGKRPSPMMAGNAAKTKGNEQAIADYLAAQ